MPAAAGLLPVHTSHHPPRAPTPPALPLAAVAGTLRVSKYEDKKAAFEDRAYRLHHNKSQCRADLFASVRPEWGKWWGKVCTAGVRRGPAGLLPCMQLVWFAPLGSTLARRCLWHALGTQPALRAACAAGRHGAGRHRRGGGAGPSSGGGGGRRVRGRRGRPAGARGHIQVGYKSRVAACLHQAGYLVG